MKLSLMSAAAAVCTASGLAMAQNGSCCEDAAKAGECEVIVECVGEGGECVAIAEVCLDGEAAPGVYQVTLTTDENGETTANLELVSESRAAIGEVAFGAQQPEANIETHMVMIQQNDDHEIKVEITGDVVKAWVDGERVPKKQLKVSDEEIRILDEDGETLAEFGRQIDVQFGLGGGEEDHKIIMRQLHGGPDGPIVWEGGDGEQMKILKGLGGDTDLQFFGEDGNHLFAQPEGEHPPVMIGITMGSLDKGEADDRVIDLLDERNLGADEVFVVLSVIDGLPAEKAGLHDGDVVVRVDGKWGVGSEKLRDMLMDKEPGDQVELAVVRDGKLREITVKLAAWDSEKLGTPLTLEWTEEAPNMFLHGGEGGDVQMFLEKLREHEGQLGEDLGKQFEVIIKQLGEDGKGGIQRLDVLPRIQTRRLGEGGENRFFVQPAPAPRVQDMQGYQERFDRIEARLERLENRIDRLLKALEGREQNDD